MGEVAPKLAELDELEAIDSASVADLEPKLINLMQQSEALVALMRGFFQQLDKRRSDEFAIIAGYISKAKDEIRELRPHDLSHERIPSAGAELQAITRDTEDATNTIMNCAEAIMGMDVSDPKAYKTSVDDEVMKIFEACSFQDITGQRVSKIINVLQQIEERVGKLAATLGVDDKAKELTEREIRARDLLLNGPAIGGPETRQDAIDAMFDEAVEAPVKPEAKVQAPQIAPKPEPEPMAKVEAPPMPVAKAPEPKPEPKPAPVVEAPKPAPKPEPEPEPVKAAAPTVKEAVVEDKANSQDDIDSLFDMSPEDLNKTNSQDDIDALFD
jgi:chemotaxis regulatin CheY-phosphate phosphatase CheZ